jgi:pimeloyl-ACP methyl ester carboxylesterase
VILSGSIRGAITSIRALIFTRLKDVISGVGFTTPSIQVFRSPEEKSSWELREQGDPLHSETADAFARSYARWSVFGHLALERTRISAEYASTAMVARDMLLIIRAFGFEKLKYLGWSYGTMVGVTFAAMFPDHIERLVLE